MEAQSHQLFLRRLLHFDSIKLAFLFRHQSAHRMDRSRKRYQPRRSRPSSHRRKSRLFERAAAISRQRFAHASASKAGGSCESAALAAQKLDRLNNARTLYFGISDRRRKPSPERRFFSDATESGTPGAARV